VRSPDGADAATTPRERYASNKKRSSQAACVAIGAGIGAGIGAAIGNVAVGIGVGIAIGAAIGSRLPGSGDG
jgi:uncharacterized membrane protein YgaE (UPF0421/DUF939 family)